MSSSFYSLDVYSMFHNKYTVMQRYIYDNCWYSSALLYFYFFSCGCLAESWSWLTVVFCSGQISSKARNDYVKERWVCIKLNNWFSISQPFNAEGFALHASAYTLSSVHPLYNLNFGDLICLSLLTTQTKLIPHFMKVKTVDFNNQITTTSKFLQFWLWAGLPDCWLS